MKKRTKVIILAAILLILALLVALGIDAGLTSLRVYRNLQSAKAGLFNALDALRSRDFSAASAAFREAQGKLDQARSDFASHPVSMGAAKAVPFVATQVEAMESFVSIASGLTQGGNHLCEIATGFPGLDPSAESENLSIGQMVDLMEQFQNDLSPIEQILSVAQWTSSYMDSNWLVSPAAKAKQELDDKLSSASDELETARELMEAFSDFMGEQGAPPNRYALILQDCYELRGSGGVMSTYGILECTHDAMKITECERAGTLRQGVDIEKGLPQPLRDFWPQVQNPTLHFWDAGWWPDFPTTAAFMNEILTANGKDAVRGYIAVDPIAIQDVLRELGPLDLPEFNVTITADNLPEKLLYYIEANTQTRPMQAQFLKDLTYGFFTKITEASPGQWFELGKTLGRALTERHLLVYFNDPALQEIFSEKDWSGGMKDKGSDYLLAVDNNIGGNNVGYKANLIITEKMRLQLSLELGDMIGHRVTYYIDNTNGLTYFRSSLSLYIPPTALPLEDPAIESVTEELGKCVLTKTIEVAPGDIAVLDFDYLTPRYDSILIQKQPGQVNLPVGVCLLQHGQEIVTDFSLVNEMELFIDP